MPSIDSVPAKPRPHSSGTSDDSKMPANDVVCQISQTATAPPAA